MTVIYHPEAEAELIEAARFYARRVDGLGAEFLAAALSGSRWPGRTHSQTG